MAKTVIVYYSYTGNTARIVRYLQEMMDWDVVELRPARQARLTGFLKYFIGGFLSLNNILPKLENVDVDWVKYDTIIMAGPVWAGRLAPAIRSFIKAVPFSNKDVGFLYTHEGGDKKVNAQIRNMIGSKNNLKGVFSCLNVVEDYENIKEEALAWARTL